MELINAKDAMSRLNNNHKLYVMLLKKFDAESLLDDLLTKIKDGDTAAAAVSAHTLKGLAANLSLADLRAKSETIESRLKDGDINVDTAEIELSVTRTTEAVNAWIEENS